MRRKSARRLAGISSSSRGTCSGWVAGKIETSRRRDVLSFSHHKLAAAMEPPVQDRWLDRAEEPEGQRATDTEWWPSRELWGTLALSRGPRSLEGHGSLTEGLALWSASLSVAVLEDEEEAP
jgi:hypothetical protein